MHIALDRTMLLGFEACRTSVAVPAHASKVGTKDSIVLSASHCELSKKLCTPTKTTLTFPVKAA